MFPTKLFHPGKTKRTPAPRFRQLALGGLFLSLAVVAVIVQTAPQRRARYLKSASLEQLYVERSRNVSDPDLNYRIGVRLQALGQNRAAYDAFEASAKQDADSELFWLAAADAGAHAYGDPFAFNLLNYYLQRHPASGKARLAIAWLYYKNHDMDRAQEEAVRATQQLPANADAWFLRGISSAATYLNTDAEQSLRKAIALNHSDWRYFTALGDTLGFLLQKRDKTEALSAYRAAVRLNPQSAKSHLALGQLLMHDGVPPPDLAAAWESLHRAQSLAPNDPVVYHQLGLLLTQQQREKEAIPMLETSVRLSSRDPKTLYLLAQAYSRVGNMARCERNMAKFKEASLLSKPEAQAFRRHPLWKKHAAAANGISASAGGARGVHGSDLPLSANAVSGPGLLLCAAWIGGSGTAPASGKHHASRDRGSGKRRS